MVKVPGLFPGASVPPSLMATELVIVEKPFSVPLLETESPLANEWVPLIKSRVAACMPSPTTKGDPLEMVVDDLMLSVPALRLKVPLRSEEHTSELQSRFGIS